MLHNINSLCLLFNISCLSEDVSERVSYVLDATTSSALSFSPRLINTLRTGAFELFKCTFPGSKQFKSTFILCFFKNL